MTATGGAGAGTGETSGSGPGHDAGLDPELVWRTEDDGRLPALLWRAGDGWRMISSALVGGGIGPAGWVLNAQVPGGYARLDPVDHLGELAASFRLGGPGVGMLTAAAVEHWRHRSDEGVSVAVTVGLRVPTWAARPHDAVDQELAPERLGEGGPWRPGTINIIVAVPVALTDAALVNAVATATEAKTQALWEAGYPCTGTASDAVCVAARDGAGRSGHDGVRGPTEPFAGPRSTWGARIARAVHAAVHAGAVDYTERMLGRAPVTAMCREGGRAGIGCPGVQRIGAAPAGSGLAGHPDDDLGDPPCGLVG